MEVVTDPVVVVDATTAEPEVPAVVVPECSTVPLADPPLPLSTSPSQGTSDNSAAVQKEPKASSESSASASTTQPLVTRLRVALRSQPTSSDPDTAAAAVAAPHPTVSVNVAPSTVLDHVAATNMTIPVWLLLAWAARARDSPSALVELMTLRHCALPATLCEVLPTVQHDAAVRALLTFFQNVHRVTNTAAMSGGTASAALAQVGVITPPSLAATVEQQQQQSASPQITGMRSTDSSQSLTGSVFATAASASASPVMLHHRRLSVASQTGGMSPSPAVGRRRDYAIAFLEEVIRREVANAQSDASLFRSNNIVSRLLSHYANGGSGRDYLRMTLCQPIEAVLAMGTMEVDPVRVRSAMMSTGNGDTITEEDVQAAVNVNMQRLLDGTNHLIDSILSSVDRLPLGLRKLATIIAKQVEKKFAPNSPQARRYRLMYKQPSHSRSVSVVGRSGSIVGVGGGVAVTAHSSMAAVASQGTLQSHSSSGGSSVVANSITGSPSPGVVDAETIKHHVAVRGFIFLRVICPAIVTPDAFGLVSHSLTPQQRRSLVLISKVIQNIANCVRFGGKEQFMTPANDIIDENEMRVDNYCNALLSLDAEGVYMTAAVDDAASAVKPEDAQANVSAVMAMVREHMDKLAEPLSKVLVSEQLVYNVFGAIKPVLKASRESVDHDEWSRVPLLCEGFAEVLAMNDCVLIRSLLVDEAVAGLEGPARNAAALVVSQGGHAVTTVCEWLLQQEVKSKESTAAVVINDTGSTVFVFVKETLRLCSVYETPASILGNALQDIAMLSASDMDVDAEDANAIDRLHQVAEMFIKTATSAVVDMSAVVRQLSTWLVQRCGQDIAANLLLRYYLVPMVIGNGCSRSRCLVAAMLEAMADGVHSSDKLAGSIFITALTSSSGHPSGDTTLVVPASLRRHAIVTLRKILTRPVLRRLRTVIEYESAPSSRGALTHDVLSLIALESSAGAAGVALVPARKMLDGRREHTLQYPLWDRLRVVLWATDVNAASAGAPPVASTHGTGTQVPYMMTTPIASTTAPQKISRVRAVLQALFKPSATVGEATSASAHDVAIDAPHRASKSKTNKSKSHSHTPSSSRSFLKLWSRRKNEESGGDGEERGGDGEERGGEAAKVTASRKARSVDFSKSVGSL